MTDERQLFKNFGAENERNDAGLYVMIGFAIIAVMAFVARLY